MAASGCVFTLAWATRNDFEPLSAADVLLILDELETERIENTEIPAPELRQQPPVGRQGKVDDYLHDFRRLYDLKLLKNDNGVQLKWLGPYCLNTPGAMRVLLAVQKSLRSLQSDGTMTNFL